MNGSLSEIESLKAQINQEEQLKQTVEQSYQELLSTSKELEKRMNMIDDESNEWKTRFENQEEINRQLIKQIAMYEKKSEETKNRSKNIKNKLMIENNNEANPEHIKEFKNTKESLENQLKDYAWRIEQENKAYHKANEERKEIHQELVETREQFTKAKNDRQLKASIFISEMPTAAHRKTANLLNNQSVYLPSIYSSYDNYNDTSPRRKSEYNHHSPNGHRRSNREHRTKLN